MPNWSYPWQKVTDPLAIPAGALRHAIQIQSQNAGTQDSYGDVSGTWNAVLNCFAAVETISMKQAFQDGFVSMVVHRVTIRWPGHSVPITDAMRVVRGNSVYLIQAVENVQQRDRVLHLTCIEIDNAKVGT